MANKKFLVGTLAIVLALGMAVAGCSKGANSGSSGGEKAASAGMPGSLKITGLPDQNWSVAVLGTNIDLSTLTNISSIAETSIEAYGTRLSSGETPFSLTGMTGVLWTVTGKRQVVLVNQDHDRVNMVDKNNPLARTATVNFSNGSATVKFSSFTAVTKN
jgi:hypothetical protein